MFPLDSVRDLTERWGRRHAYPCRRWLSRPPLHASHSLDLRHTWPSYASALIQESSAWGAPIRSGASEERGAAPRPNGMWTPASHGT